ncbi:MAG: hypothetical protein HYY06_04885 [Deltaproteobacteria bacterium]|nr:hypothetical protein [Deltaproteobacteria bacterium]
MRRWPKVQLFVPREIHPGESFIAEVALRCKSEVPVEFIDVTFQSEERLTTGGDLSAPHVVVRPALRARVSEAQCLPKGDHRFAARFELPRDVPPSYVGRSIEHRSSIEVLVSIPWWPDARSTFEVVVTRARPPALGAARPAIRFSTAGPVSREPYCEGSLVRDVVFAGGTLEGAIALGNVEYNRYTAIGLSLVGVERVGAAQAEAHRYSIVLPVVEPVEGRVEPFRMRLPEGIQPSFSHGRTSLSWSLEIELEVAWGQNLTASVPLTVALPEPDEPSKVARPQAAAHVIGSERWRRIWTQEAERSGLTLTREQQLDGTRGPVSISIRRNHRGADGIYLVGRLSWPSLGLDLVLQKRCRANRARGQVVEVGDDEAARELRVVAREPEQVHPLLPARLLRVLGRFESVLLDDDGALLSVRDAGHNPVTLGTFVSDVVDVAESMSRAPESIPPPAALAGAAPAWRRFARELGGTLQSSRMWIAGGSWGGLPVAVGTTWTPRGKPEATVIEVGLAPPLDFPIQLAFETAEPEDEGRTLERIEGLEGEVAARIDRRARAALAKLFGRSRRVELSSSAVRTAGPAPCMDPALLVSQLGASVELARALRRELPLGPYR